MKVGRRYTDHTTLPYDLSSNTVQEDSANTMWSTYMKEALEYDNLMTEAWREDAKGFLVFVSPRPLVQYGHRTDNVERLVFSP